MSKIQVNLPFSTRLCLDGEGGGTVSSELVQEFADQDVPGNTYAKVAADALESLLLALACAGVDMSQPKIETAVINAVEAISQNLGDEPATTVVVVVMGGLVQNVISDGEIKAIIADHDTDGAQEGAMFVFSDNDGGSVEVAGGRIGVEIDPGLIRSIVAGVHA